ncbi:MAG: LLM class flavin-dependent oxidoreductase [Solirubrobacteraceae bacterium]
MSAAGVTPAPPRPGIKLFSTCPQSRDLDPIVYRERVTQAAGWSEAAGCEGILVYTDNGIVDPWLIAQLIIQATDRLCPLVAVQPAYMHPYSVAKMVTSLAHLHGRRIYLNLVAGGFRNDLEALGDRTEHDERYRRALEYGLIIGGLTGGSAVTFAGQHYEVRNLRLTPPVPAVLAPAMMISGSSEAGMAVAGELEAIAIKYPQPSDQEPAHGAAGVEIGMRVGVIVREDAEEAWRIARERFPIDRTGQLTQQLATRVSDSSWHHQLSALARERSPEPGVYWLGPFENYASFCPYLVGDYGSVGRELTRYLELGFSTFILDIPRGESDLRHAAQVFRRAVTG